MAKRATRAPLVIEHQLPDLKDGKRRDPLERGVLRYAWHERLRNGPERKHMDRRYRKWKYATSDHMRKKKEKDAHQSIKAPASYRFCGSLSFRSRFCHTRPFRPLGYILCFSNFYRLAVSFDGSARLVFVDPCSILSSPFR